MGTQHVVDMAGRGRTALVEYSGPTPGSSCSRRGNGSSSRSFRVPNINWNDPNLRQIDLNGDGQAELVITEDHAITWYPAEDEAGLRPRRTPWDFRRGAWPGARLRQP